MAMTMGIAEAKNNLSRVASEVERTGTPVTILRNNKTCAAIVPMEMLIERDPVSAAVDFMDEYADVFRKLA